MPRSKAAFAREHHSSLSTSISKRLRRIGRPLVRCATESSENHAVAKAAAAPLWEVSKRWIHACPWHTIINHGGNACQVASKYKPPCSELGFDGMNTTESYQINTHIERIWVCYQGSRVQKITRWFCCDTTACPRCFVGCRITCLRIKEIFGNNNTNDHGSYNLNLLHFSSDVSPRTTP